MAAMPDQQAGVYPKPSASQAAAPNGQLDLDYYLKEALEGVELLEYRGTEKSRNAVESQIEGLNAKTLARPGGLVVPGVLCRVGKDGRAWCPSFIKTAVLGVDTRALQS
ncbi:hypothetical protein HOY80DRAFT_1047577 [Tuber brumale]|nr:hypothetical protein HOY80DRAFT_1047577 [Tuber brumale]